jgi:putative oxidoreductase
MTTTTADRNQTAVGSERAAGSTKTVRDFTELGGRVLLATLFLVAGVGKIGGYAATAGYMTAVGLPSALLPAVIATEVLGAIAIAVGWQTRITAFLLAGLTLLSALFFHSDFGDQVQSVMFLKNVSIAGGFLLLVANGAGRFSVDARAEKRHSFPT